MKAEARAGACADCADCARLKGVGRPCAARAGAVFAHSRAHCPRVCAGVKYLRRLDFKL